jgi:hypothetical protein
MQGAVSATSRNEEVAPRRRGCRSARYRAGWWRSGAGCCSTGAPNCERGGRGRHLRPCGRARKRGASVPSEDARGGARSAGSLSGRACGAGSCAGALSDRPRPSRAPCSRSLGLRALPSPRRSAAPRLWGSETASAGCVASGADHSFFRLFERRRTCVHHDGVEFERTPLFEHLERPVPGPQRRVRVPPV